MAYINLYVAAINTLYYNRKVNRSFDIRYNKHVSERKCEKSSLKSNLSLAPLL